MYGVLQMYFVSFVSYMLHGKYTFYKCPQSNNKKKIIKGSFVRAQK